jgi:hypothetical protein
MLDADATIIYVSKARQPQIASEATPRRPAAAKVQALVRAVDCLKSR